MRKLSAGRSNSSDEKMIAPTLPMETEESELIAGIQLGEVSCRPHYRSRLCELNCMNCADCFPR
jgi:hypothetical protein